MNRYYFRYREFYDVPRLMLVDGDDYTLRLESLFNDESEDYEPFYSVRIAERLSKNKTAINFTDNGMRWRTLGRLPVSELRFSATKRSFFTCPALDALHRAAIPFSENRV